MGAEQFETESNGKDLAEAFQRAVDGAFYDWGHAGYTGSICEKPGAYLIPTPKGVTAQDVVEAIVAAQGWDNARSVWPDMKPEFVEQQNKYYELADAAFAKVAKWFGQDEAAKIVTMSDDKWEDAIAIELADDELGLTQLELKEGHPSREGQRWFLFFGWASS